MSSTNKLFSSLSLAIMLLPTLFSCSQNEDYIYLKVLNSEDYIYKKEDEGDKEDLIIQFEEYYNNNIRKEGEKKVKVIYDTFDTMENMFNTLKTGKTTYDLVCASDYMIQKLAKLNLIDKLDHKSVPSYYNDDYNFEIEEKSYGCSPYIRNIFKNVPAIGKESSDENNLDNYCVNYMWGTLGILYNPTYSLLKERGLSEDRIHNDMLDWGSLWDSSYKKSIAIKDSMRDTYAVGVMHSFKEELKSAETFEERNKIFNYGGENDTLAKEHIKVVQADLINLRSNIFGFEVDSGKQDIVTGKIGIDTAWSGDAVKSMNDADDIRVKDPSQAPILYYSIPSIGTNLWFDSWAIQSKATNKSVAYKFLDFISKPENVIQNMRYTGYTSPIAGVETFNYFNEKYSTSEGNKYDVSYFFNSNGETSTMKHYFTIKDSEINRQIAAQFPKQELNEKLMVMRDYGENNDLILKMWEEVKHESLPLWAIILFSCEIALALGGVTFIIVRKAKDKRLRKKRKLSKVGASK